MTSLSRDEPEAWIPCEYCEEMVRFEDYIYHVRECVEDQTVVIIPISDREDDPDPELYVPNGNSHRGLVMVRARTTQQARDSEYDAQLQLAELLGKVEIGVSSLSDVTKEITESEDYTCVICQDVQPKGTILLQTLCKHAFCKPCITTWFERHKKCPLCMLDMDYLTTSNNDK